MSARVLIDRVEWDVDVTPEIVAEDSFAYLLRSDPDMEKLVE